MKFQKINYKQSFHQNRNNLTHALAINRGSHQNNHVLPDRL